MTKFYVKYDRYEYITRECDPEDQWDRDDTAAEITVTGVVISKGNEYFDVALPQDYDPSKPLYLLWADYDTGDSFGRDGNRFEAVDLFQDRDMADAAKSELERSESEGYTRDDGTYIKYYKCWDGYFEYLNDLHVEPVTVYSC